MADCADDDGSDIYPSVAYVAWLVGCSKRIVQIRLQELVETGVLEVVAYGKGGKTADGTGHTTQYRLHEERLPVRLRWKSKRRGKGEDISPLLAEIGVTKYPTESKGEIQSNGEVSAGLGCNPCRVRVKSVDHNPSVEEPSENRHETLPASPDSPNKRIKFNTQTQKLEGIEERDRERLLKTYPGVNLDQTIRELEDWLVRNPENYLKRGARLADRLSNFCRTAATRPAWNGNGSAPKRGYSNDAWKGRKVGDVTW